MTKTLLPSTLESMQPKITKLEKSRIEIEGEIPETDFKTFEAKAVEHLLANFEMPGFRKGKVPVDVFRKQIGDMPILEEMAELAMAKHYPEILESEKIDAIGRPEIMITKLAKDNPLGFKIRTAVLPELTLPDYKKIAAEAFSKEVKVEVTEKDVDDAILEFRKMRAHQELHKGDAGESHDHNHPEITEETLPPFDDTFAQAVGNFKTVDELKEKIRENILLEKKNKEEEKKRIAAVEKIIDGVKVDVPEILVEAELNKMFHRMESDISNMGLNMDDYLKHVKKTKESLREEWHKDAERRAILELTLNKIAQVETITVPKENIDAEVKKLMDMYKDADPLQAELYVENILRNEKVFSFLEGLK